MSEKAVVILGAGLAGLACALTLHRQGRKVLIVEQNSEVGGRVKTRKTDSGFLVDEGFQVLLNSYPELSNFVNLEKLNLRPFKSGALIFNGKSLDLIANPARHPETILSGVLTKLLTLNDKARVLGLLASAQRHRKDAPLGQTTTIQYLRDSGFSEKFIENFWRPFLAGVYLDADLGVGSDYFKFLIRCFGLGSVSLPALGMAELPKQMASQLPADSIRLSTPVKSWTGTSVLLQSGETIDASQVVVAFDPLREKSEYREVTTHYFTSEKIKDLKWDGWLVLIPQHLGYLIDHMAIITSVAPSYGPIGKTLLSVSLIGKKQASKETLMKEIEIFAGQKLALDWIDTTHIKKALPVLKVETEGFKRQDGVLFCGDHMASPSINGALRSGRMAGESLL